MRLLGVSLPLLLAACPTRPPAPVDVGEAVASAAPPPVASAAPPAKVEPDVDWPQAVFACETRVACLAAAARVPPDEPYVAAVARAKAFTPAALRDRADRCLGDAMMAGINDDASEACDRVAPYAQTEEDRALVRGAIDDAVRKWKAYKAHQAGSARP